jgi:hypothetical protein
MHHAFNQTTAGGTRWGRRLRLCATSREFAGSIGDVIGIFIDIIFPAALWPRVRISLWQKRVLGMFPGGKVSRCVGQPTLPPSCADWLEILGLSNSWNLPGLYRYFLSFYTTSSALVSKVDRLYIRFTPTLWNLIRTIKYQFSYFFLLFSCFIRRI